MAMTWDNGLKDVFRPDDVHMGVLKADPDKCTGCGLCIQNCLFRAWEMGDDNVPKFKEGWACFSCYNCMVVCPAGAIDIVEPYHVDSGFWKTQPGKLPALKPLQPQDAEGNPAEWSDVEKAIVTRRSVRNFSDKPVPEPLIRRVLEAGRFSPTSGNCQPFQFTVVTDPDTIAELNQTSFAIIKGMYDAYTSEEGVRMLAEQYAAAPNPGGWDPRIILGGVGVSVVQKVNDVLLGAPAVILIAGDARSIGGPQMQVGICGTNMILAANSIGLKATWVGFVAYSGGVPSLMEKVGIAPPFTLISSVVLGYPKFKQEGIVHREYRPVNWVRQGKGLEVEETPPLPEVDD